MSTQADSPVPVISVIVPTRNNSATILDLLRSIYEQSYPDFEVILIDSSTDGTAELASKHYPIRVVREKRLGLNVARNTSVRYSRGSILAFIDADSVADRNWLLALLKHFSNAEVGAVGGSIFAQEAESLLIDYQENTRFPFKPKFKDVNIIDSSNFHKHRFPVGGNMALRRSIFNKVKTFDSSFVYAADEFDFLWRVVKAGFKIVVTPEAVVHGGHVSGVRKVLYLYYRLGLGSGLFARKDFDAPIARMRLGLLAIALSLATLSLFLLACAIRSPSYIAPLILVLLLPALVFTPHSIRLAYQRRKLSPLLFPFIDYFFGIVYAIGMLCGLIRKVPKEPNLTEDNYFR
jgi:glycosyltransferase involved in cell wall biosynthesis